MNNTKQEEIISVYELEVVTDIRIADKEVYKLYTGKRNLGIIFNNSSLEILSFTNNETHSGVKRLFLSYENKVQDVYDMKIILDYLLSSPETLYLNKKYRSNKK